MTRMQPTRSTGAATRLRTETHHKADARNSDNLVDAAFKHLAALVHHQQHGKNAIKETQEMIAAEQKRLTALQKRWEQSFEQSHTPAPATPMLLDLSDGNATAPTPIEPYNPILDPAIEDPHGSRAAIREMIEGRRDIQNAIAASKQRIAKLQTKLDALTKTDEEIKSWPEAGNTALTELRSALQTQIQSTTDAALKQELQDFLEGIPKIVQEVTYEKVKQLQRTYHCLVGTSLGAKAAVCATLVAAPLAGTALLSGLKKGTAPKR